MAFHYLPLLEAPADLVRRRALYPAGCPPIAVLARNDAFLSRRIPQMTRALARRLVDRGDATNAIGLRKFGSSRLDNRLTQSQFNLEPAAAVCGPLPCTLEQGAAETAAWLRTISKH